MNESLSFLPSTISDADATWACHLLQLPTNAFSGHDGNDPRLEILKSNETLDIEACPGSGKTTLLVAKLAILARKWADPRQGLCVLSHTNVARREIEQRLGNTPEGKRLLCYPHFIGTIHGFVNEFLAIPWLRSLGFPVNVIDNDHCEKHRRRLLSLAQFKALACYVNSKERSGKLNVVSNWCVASSEFDVLKENGEPEFKNSIGPAALQLSRLAASTARDGYHRYDEMFMWAHDLLDHVPEVRDAIRKRFPLLFLDEVQDNSELQSVILFRLFTDGNNPVIRQRFGDINQAIYRHASETEGARTDRFPKDNKRKDIPNSYRFGREIGDLANPLALEPQNLVGCGPPCHVITADTKGKHAIFLFNESTLQHVLGVYAGYLQELFSEEDLRYGIFTAVGGVHRPGSDDHVPRSVGQYWPEYDYELTGAEPRPSTFFQYLMAGRRLALHSGEAYHLVEKIAEGLLRLSRPSNPTANLGTRRRSHCYVLELLADHPKARDAYLDLVMFLAVERSLPSTSEWANKWLAAVTGIVEAIGGAAPEPKTTKAFLQWQCTTKSNSEATSLPQRDNIFRYPSANPKVQIRVSSIHSVKGETHTATLVFETYYHEHHLAALKPWLLGQKSGQGKEKKKRTLSRLKQHYVAMTRPSHLLCLAMREDAFNHAEIDQLKSISWRVASVTKGAPVWL